MLMYEFYFGIERCIFYQERFRVKLYNLVFIMFNYEFYNFILMYDIVVLGIFGLGSKE